MSRRPESAAHRVSLKPGTIYDGHMRGTFYCEAVSDTGAALLYSIASGVRIIVADVTMYEDGSIAWGRLVQTVFDKEAQNEGFDKTQ